MVLVFSTYACKSNKTLIQIEQAAEQPIETVATENCDTLHSIVRYTVEKNGSISNVKIRRSCGYPAYDSEALQITKKFLELFPPEQCGKPVRIKFDFPVQRGKPVRVKFDTSVTFDPCGKSNFEIILDSE